MFDWRTGGCKLVFLSSNEYEDLVPTRLTESLVSSVLFIVILFMLIELASNIIDK